jgi:hypothetical protein
MGSVMGRKTGQWNRSENLPSYENAVFWNIKPHFVPHRRPITSLLESPAS